MGEELMVSKLTELVHTFERLAILAVCSKSWDESQHSKIALIGAALCNLTR